MYHLSDHICSIYNDKEGSKRLICREFESKGVSLLFVDTEDSSTPEGQLFFNLMSVIAQYELALIKKRTVRGRLKAVERDKKIMPMRVAPFGYNFENQNLVINEKEAEVVRSIYQWYIFDNLTLREIGGKLFELAKEQKIKNSTGSGNRKYEYLLKSLIKCAHCGRTWNCTTYTGKQLRTRESIKYTCYRCPNKNPRRYGDGIERCPAQTLRADLLDDYIWNLVMSVISDPNEYIEQLGLMSESIVTEMRSAVELIKNQMTEKTKAVEKIKIMFRRDVIDEEQMAEEIANINADKWELQQSLDNYLSQIAAFDEGNMNAEKIILATEQIQKFIDNGGSELLFDDKRRIVEWLIDEVRVHYLGDEVQLTTIGHLEGLLAEQTNDDSIVGVVLHRKFKLKRANNYSPKKIVE